MGGRYFYGPGLGFFGGLLWVAIFAAFIGLVAWAVYALIRHEHRMAGPVGPGLRGPFASGPPAPPPGWGIHHDDALNAARVRYARGEIDREQYFRVVEDLTGVPRPHGSAPYGAPPPPAPAGQPPAAPAFPPGPPLPRPEWNPGSAPGWPSPASPGGGHPGGSDPGVAPPSYPNPGPPPSPPEAGGPEA